MISGKEGMSSMSSDTGCCDDSSLSVISGGNSMCVSDGVESSGATNVLEWVLGSMGGGSSNAGEFLSIVAPAFYDESQMEVSVDKQML